MLQELRTNALFECEFAWSNWRHFWRTFWTSVQIALIGIAGIFVAVFGGYHKYRHYLRFAGKTYKKVGMDVTATMPM